MDTLARMGLDLAKSPRTSRKSRELTSTKARRMDLVAAESLIRLQRMAEGPFDARAGSFGATLRALAAQLLQGAVDLVFGEANIADFG